MACVLHCVVHCDQDVSLNIDVELTFIHEHERTLPKAIAPVHQVLIHFSRFDGELTIVSTDGGGGASTHWWSSIDHSYRIVGNSACLPSDWLSVRNELADIYKWQEWQREFWKSSCAQRTLSWWCLKLLLFNDIRKTSDLKGQEMQIISGTSIFSFAHVHIVHCPVVVNG